MKTTIVGGRFVGRAWAIGFARAGHAVALWDAAPDALPRALDFIDGVLPDLAAHDLLNGATPAIVRGRMAAVPELAQALAGTGYVQESTPEPSRSA